MAKGRWRLEDISDVLIKTFPDAVTVTDLDGNLLYVSPRTLELHGFESAEELLGKSAFELIAPKDHKRAKVNMGKTLKEGVARNLTYTLLRKDGASFIGELNAALIRDAGGKPRAFIATTRDVTERRRISEKLRESEERYRTLFEQAADSIALFDATGAAVEFNEKAHKNLGYTRSEFQKLKIHDFSARSSKEVSKRIENVLRKGAAAFEAKHRTKGGEIQDILVNCKTISFGGRNYIQAIWRDITESKRMQEDLKQSKEKLLQQTLSLEQKNIALHEFIEQIEIEKNKMKDDITVNVEELLLPIIEKLRIKKAARKYIELLRYHLKELVSSFGRKITEKSLKLTPREIEICGMVKGGLTSKEISGLLSISSQTVEKHRRNIREKLGISNKDINLTSFLHSI